MMDHDKFYNGVRDAFGSLTKRQVTGINAILSACEGMPLDHVAYVLATAYHETGGALYPNRENMTYTSAARIKSVFGTSRLQGIAPSSLVRSGRKLANVVYGGEWGKKNLGNTQDGDGYNLRGGGFDHTTGRSNYRKASAAVSLDLLNHPELIVNPDVAASVISAGMSVGWYRGKKLSDYAYGDYYNMRDIINADKSKNGATVANYAVKFEAALNAGEWGVTPIYEPETVEKPHWFIVLMKALFGGKK